MTPIDILRDEHRLILRALEALESAADRPGAGPALPEPWWRDAVDWLRAFADANHHGKEERCLFPSLAKAGVPSDGGPVAVMLDEHDQGRALIRAIESSDPAGRSRAARDYVRLLREHIDKENDVLFPMAEAVLDAAALRTLGREFEAVESDWGQGAPLDRAEAQLGRLAAALERGKPAT